MWLRTAPSQNQRTRKQKLKSKESKVEGLETFPLLFLLRDERSNTWIFGK